MDTIQIKDKLFTVSIKEQDIQKEVIRVATKLTAIWQVRIRFFLVC